MNETSGNVDPEKCLRKAETVNKSGRVDKMSGVRMEAMNLQDQHDVCVL